MIKITIANPKHTPPIPTIKFFSDSGFTKAAIKKEKSPNPKKIKVKIPIENILLNSFNDNKKRECNLFPFFILF